jgi:hypothetical protein
MVWSGFLDELLQEPMSKTMAQTKKEIDLVMVLMIRSKIKCLPYILLTKV